MTGVTTHGIPLEQPLAAVPLVFVDVETTGLTPADGHRVCEVALLREVPGQPPQSFTTLVDPRRDLDAQAAAVNGISPALLVGAPTFDQVAGQVTVLLAGAVLVAHNAPFDRAFLRLELARLGQSAPAEPFIDTLALARRLLRRPSYSLQALATAIGAATPNHRAFTDVLALRAVFDYLVQLLAERQITTLYDVLRFQRGLHPGQAEPEPPELIGLALTATRRLRIVYRSRTSIDPIERVIQPLELAIEARDRLFVRAFCYLRNDYRAFAVDKIEAMELE